MSPTQCVWAVLGRCWVGFRHPTQFLGFYFAALRMLCRVCWVCLRVRAWASLFEYWAAGFFSYARTVKPHTPNTVHSTYLRVLNLKAFNCVGCVSGWPFLVLGCCVGGRAGR